MFCKVGTSLIMAMILHDIINRSVLLRQKSSDMKMQNTLCDDMTCLVESLEYMIDDDMQRLDALKELANMCLEGKFIFDRF